MGSPFEPKLTIEEVDNAFDQYRVFDNLGAGGQGSVFRGVDLRTGQEVALKIYSPNQLIKRAELEVNKLEQVESSYLAQVIEHGNARIRDFDVYYVATKYMVGSDLKEVLKTRNLSEIETKQLLIHILSAIEDLWKLRVVHSDIKPANILYLSNGDFVLIDLGFAKHLDNDSITMGQAIMGTLGYIAPEQLRGRRNLTLRADMFPLGILAYEAVTGIHPFQRNQNLIFGKQPVIPINNHLNIEVNLAESIHWLMELNPLKRPVSCQKVIEHLKEGE